MPPVSRLGSKTSGELNRSAHITFALFSEQHVISAVITPSMCFDLLRSVWCIKNLNSSSFRIHLGCSWRQNKWFETQIASQCFLHAEVSDISPVKVTYMWLCSCYCRKEALLACNYVAICCVTTAHICLFSVIFFTKCFFPAFKTLLKTFKRSFYDVMDFVSCRRQHLTPQWI